MQIDLKRKPSRIERVLGILLSFVAMLFSGLCAIGLLVSLFIEEFSLIVLGLALAMVAIFLTSLYLFRRFCFTRPEKVEEHQKKPSIRHALLECAFGVVVVALVYIYFPDENMPTKVGLMMIAAFSIVFGFIQFAMAKDAKRS